MCNKKRWHVCFGYDTCVQHAAIVQQSMGCSEKETCHTSHLRLYRVLWCSHSIWLSAHVMSVEC